MTDISDAAQAALDYARTWGWGRKGHFGGEPGDEAGCLITVVLKGTGEHGCSNEYRALRETIKARARELYPRPSGGTWASMMEFYDHPATTTEMVETVLEKIAAEEGIDE